MSNKAARVQIYAATANSAFAEKIAVALDADGCEIVNGEFDPATSDAVVVVWSGVSIGSQKLIDAAKAPLAAGVLVPVSIGRVEPPEGFKHLPPMNLGGWTGDIEDPRWRFVRDEVGRAAKIMSDAAADEPAAADATDQDLAAALPAPLAPSPEPVLQAPPAESAPAREKPFFHTAPAPPPSGERSPAALIFGFAIIAAIIIGGFGTLFLAKGRDRPQVVAPIAESPDTERHSETAAAPSEADDETPLLASVRPIEETSRRNAGEDEKEAGEASRDLLAAAEDNPAGVPPDGAEHEEEPASPEEMAPDDVADAPAEAAVAEGDDADDIASLIESGGDTEDEDGLNTDQLAQLIEESAGGPAEPESYPGDFFKDCDLCPEMRALPAGSFKMGSPASEPARQNTEGPVTAVTLAGRVAIGTREVTYEQWQACVAGGGCRNYSPPDFAWGRGRMPVVAVSWEDARAYADWLAQKTGKPYRLPTEAEWEYAARAGTVTPFSFGSSVSPKQANFDGSLTYGAKRGEYRQKPVAVGSFEPNPFGLFDMHGNVWEWVADCWRPSHADAAADGSAVGGECARRVLKGGAWNSGGWRLRAAHRIGKPQTAREFDNGFRVARELN